MVKTMQICVFFSTILVRGGGKDISKRVINIGFLMLFTDVRGVGKLKGQHIYLVVDL